MARQSPSHASNITRRTMGLITYQPLETGVMAISLWNIRHVEEEMTRANSGYCNRKPAELRLLAWPCSLSVRAFFRTEQLENAERICIKFDVEELFTHLSTHYNFG
jgi:hypothetical protein